MTRNAVVSAVVGVVGPLLVAAAIVPWRVDVTPVNAALLLVLAVVAVAASGHRASGAVAALSAAVWFDFFLTEPYEHLSIADRADLETAVLLLGVGLAVAELASWGRRQQAERSRMAGYAAGVQASIEASVEAVVDDAAPGVVVEQVAQQVGRLLQVQCRFDYGAGVIGGATPRLGSGGEVEIGGRRHDVEGAGLPVGRPIELLVSSSGRYLGRFVLTAETVVRPALAQRLAAVTLADRAAHALAAAGPHAGAMGAGWAGRVVRDTGPCVCCRRLHLRHIR